MQNLPIIAIGPNDHENNSSWKPQKGFSFEHLCLSLKLIIIIQIKTS